ncbi:MAG: ubiquinol-cytochrome c reductase cytochrome c subunit [Thermoleophilaceae bacterium]|nr:ubiquinol-cytochrome c reductase cytochrome c subunit [Thermoleophilaceae bacterium]
MKRVVVPAAAVAAALALVAGAPTGAATSPATHGKQLYNEACASCHGMNLEGIPHRAPKLRGVGAAAADFYLRTGRMPLNKPTDQPLRGKPAFSHAEIAALVGYIASFGGPPIPMVHPENGDLAAGRHAFAGHCAGCHQIVGEGGIVTGARVPNLSDSTPVDVAEAVRVGPYVMPPFGQKALTQHDVDSIARYVQYTKSPDDRGGWSIAHIGPVPEGMVAWFIGALALVLVARMLGQRRET